MLAGFFGIGGGFLIVPALMLATGMALPSAIGTSLVAVTAFGLATAGSYATSGLHRLAACAARHWWRCGRRIAGTRLNAVVAAQKTLLNRLFGGGVIAVGGTIVARGLPNLLGASTN